MDNNCILCSGRDVDIMYDVYGTDASLYNMVMCKRCNVASIAPIPVFEIIAKEYNEEYYKKDTLKLKSLLENDLPFFKLKRGARVESFKNGGRILDIGCGGGGFLKSLDKKRWERHGLEISAGTAANAEKNGINIKISKLSIGDYPDSYFDVVTLWHVFEHIINPIEHLKIIHKILKKNGVLVIAVPNIGSLEAKLFRRCWYHIDAPRHIYHYSTKGLEELMKRHGFKVIKTKLFIPKNIYGIIISFLNLSGFDFNLFKDIYMGKVKLGSFRIIMQTILMILIAPMIIGLSLFLFILETALENPGTIEIFAAKEDI